MTGKGLIKTVIAVVIIAAGAAIGWAIAVATNPYATSTSTTPAAAVANNPVVPNTPLPTFTPAFATTPGANQASPGAGGNRGGQAGQGTPGAGGNRGGQGTPGAAGQGTPGAAGQTGQGAQRGRAVTATVESYDATAKILTVKDAQGASQKFAVGNARITKSEKITADEFGKMAGGNGIVLVTGDKGSDGVYNARSLTAIDTSAFTQGGQGQQGQGQQGGFGGAFGAGGFGAGGANAPVIVRGGTLADNKFTGSSFTGEAVTANVTSDTALLKQGTGSLEDLKAGTAITITARAAQGDTPAEAQTIAIS